MTKKSSLMSKFMVLLLAFAVVFTYSVMPMNQAYAASAKKPAKVTIKTAKAASASSVKVTWKKAKNAKKYEVWYSTKAKKGFKKGASVKGAKKVTATVKKLKPGKKYYFKVRAVNGKKKGAFSKVKAAATMKNASEVPAVTGEAKTGTLVTEIDMSKYDEGKVVKVWVPVPQTDTKDEYQEVSDAYFNAPKATKAEFTEKDGNKMLYLEWGADVAPADRKASLTFTAKRYDVSRSDLKDNKSVDLSAEAKEYVSKESEYVKVNDPIVKKYAAEAVKGVKDKNSVVEKTRAVYDWVINNLARLDNGEKLGDYVFDVEGCGYGNTVKILSDFDKYGIAGGHCTDLNSTFVALCRANGIAAREMFGIRLGNPGQDATSFQHCWAEFYLPGTGWVFADPADVLKAVKPKVADDKVIDLEAWKTAKASDTFKEKAEFFWGHVDNNRVVLSRGRDVTFEPAQAWGKCNTFGYPAAEVGGERMPQDFTKGGEFVYKITSKDPSKVDYVNLPADRWEPLGIKAGEITNSDYIIDVRPEGQKTANGYVPGAVECPVSNPYTEEQKAALKEAVSKKTDGRVVIICISGNMLAKNAMAALQEEGVDMSEVTYLIGGFGTWSKNYPVVAPDKKSVSIPAWVTTGKGTDGKLAMVQKADGTFAEDLTHHVLVNENGSNAPVALLNTKALPLQAYNALKAIGGVPCDKFNKAECFDADGKAINASLPADSQKVNVSFKWDGGEATMSDFFKHVKTATADVKAGAEIELEDFTTDMRFGGCMENITQNYTSNSGNQTGCITCTFSCWIGTVSNGAYAYSTEEAFVNRDKVPEKGTAVTVIYTLAN